jgi:hypothetical protein
MQHVHLDKSDALEQVELIRQRARRVFLLDVGEDFIAISFAGSIASAGPAWIKRREY